MRAKTPATVAYEYYTPTNRAEATAGRAGGDQQKVTPTPRGEVLRTPNPAGPCLQRAGTQ